MRLLKQGLNQKVTFATSVLPFIFAVFLFAACGKKSDSDSPTPSPFRNYQFIRGSG